METMENICPISERRYEEVPVDKVKVINSRNRDREQFEMNVESIDNVGLRMRANSPLPERATQGKDLKSTRLGRWFTPASQPEPESILSCSCRPEPNLDGSEMHKYL